MKFLTHNQKQIEITGTHLVHHIDVSYAELVKLFGKPCVGDAYKQDAEWDIKFEDGTIATIYNYKDGKNYCGKDRTPKTKIREWHIGGFDYKSAAYVMAALWEAKS